MKNSFCLSRRRLEAILVGAGLALSGGLAASPAVIEYVDIAAESGLTTPNIFGSDGKKNFILETTGNGAAIFDFDNDGWNDIFIANGLPGVSDEKAGSPSQLYKNDGRGNFTNVAKKAGLTKTGWAQGVCAGDYDNDGNTDLLVTYYGVNTLYRNRGDGTFWDATAAAGLTILGTRWGAGCAFVDYDKDGRLDLFVSNYVDLDLQKTPKPGADPNCRWKGIPVMCGPRGLPRALNILYRNEGGGKFRDVSEAAGMLKPGGRYGLGVVAADFDNDTWPDIYVACDMTPSLFYRNRGDGTFEEKGAEAGVAYNVDGQLQAGMGVAVVDYDSNGFLDIAKTNFSGDLPSLFQNDDGRFFDDVAQPAGLGVHQLLGWGILFLDVDEDSWPDLLIANGHVYPEVDGAEIGEKYRQQTVLFRNLGNGGFADITARAGPALRTPRPARGMASGDLDGDGHPEVVIVNMNQAPVLLKNRGPRQHAAVFRLIGVQSNRSAIGARVTVEVNGHRQMREVLSGESYFSQSDFALHFGLGSATTIDRVEVRWPNGKQQSWQELPSGQAYTLTEGKTDPEAKQLFSPRMPN